MSDKGRTMAFQIPEELFQRIKRHLEHESARLGRKVTQREFVLGLIESALEEGSFHIWAVSDIEEGMEIMTGLPSGKRNAKGVFPAGTFNRRIEDRLKKLYENGKSS